MNKGFFLSFLVIFSLLACNNNASIQEENDGGNYSAKTTITHREYLRYGETEPFMNEYGRVIQYMNNDTIIQEYCKDSTSTPIPHSDKMTRTNVIICNPQREVFIEHVFQINEHLLPIKKTYKRNYPKGSFQVSDNGKDHRIFRLMALYSKDIEGDTVLMHSNEYWHEELGLILKMDENFGRKRRRIIKLANIHDSNNNVIRLDKIMDRIYQDSTMWIKKNKEGKARF